MASFLWMSAFALGFTKTYDSDGWWHLALGRTIVEGRGFAAHEPLSFPSLGLPFYDPEWLFDIVVYLTYLAGGFAGVTLLKATIAGLSSLILWKAATLRLRSSVDRDPCWRWRASSCFRRSSLSGIASSSAPTCSSCSSCR